MWHDTMLTGCRPVWGFSHSCTSVKAQPLGSLKLSCFKPKLKLKKVARFLPGSGITVSTSEWRNGDLGQQNQTGRSSSLVCKSWTRRSSYIWHGIAVFVPNQDSRPVVKVSSSSLAVTMTAVVTKDMDFPGLTNGEGGMQAYNNLAQSEHETNLDDNEKLRRHRISVANKGKVPWNKGGKHSAETIKRIKEKTALAMRDPTVMAKLRRNMRDPRTCSEETKVKIRNTLRAKWDSKRRIRGYQETMLKEWKNCVAEAARVGGIGEEEMQWNSYSVLKKQMSEASEAKSRADRKERAEARQQDKDRVKSKRTVKSEEHRLKISAAIRAKWEDPEYQAKVKRGMNKNGNAVRHKRAQNKKPSGDRAVSEAGCIKGPLDHGFVTAVMSGEKKRRQKEDSAKERQDESEEVLAEKTKLRARDRKVDLLKRVTVPAESEEGQSSEEDFTEEVSVSAEHSFVDPHAGEKLFRLKLLQAGRSEMDQRRRETTDRAKALMAEAEQAAKKLEAAAVNNESAQASLAEIYRLMAEAEHFIQAADSLHKDGEGTSKSNNGTLWRSTMAPYQASKSSEQMTPKGQHGSTPGQDDSYGEIHVHNSSQQSEQQIAMGMKTFSTISDSEQVMMFGSEMRDKAFLDTHNPFTDDSQCASRFPSIVSLMNGSSSRTMGARRETKYGLL
ncbi:unnamed protein product [Calypogeia fissa]